MGVGTRQRRQRSRPQALWAPHSGILLSVSSAPLALSRLMFLPVDDTSVWKVPPQLQRTLILITLPRRHSSGRASLTSIPRSSHVATP